MDIKYICNKLNQEQFNDDNKIFECLYSCIKNNGLWDKLLNVLKKEETLSEINFEKKNLDNILENIDIEKKELNNKLLNTINNYLFNSIDEIKKDNKKYIKINNILLKKINILLFQDNVNDYITRFNNENLYLVNNKDFFDITNPNLLLYWKILKEKIINNKKTVEEK